MGLKQEPISATAFARLKLAVMCELKDEANMVTTAAEDKAAEHYNGEYRAEEATHRERLYKIAARAVAQAVRPR